MKEFILSGRLRCARNILQLNKLIEKQGFASEAKQTLRDYDNIRTERHSKNYDKSEETPLHIHHNPYPPRSAPNKRYKLNAQQ
jgi:hypothetical protein